MQAPIIHNGSPMPSIPCDRDAYARAIISRIRHRHDALEAVEDRLDDARSVARALRDSPQTDPNSSQASLAQADDEVRLRAIEEVSSIEAEVAARSEGLLSYAV